MSTNITRTFLRSDKEMDRYMKVMKERKEQGIIPDHFTNYQHLLIKEFKNWVIIENEFPYDAVATTSHMISTKREVRLEWKLLNKEEREEYEIIKEEYLKNNYDAVWENFPSGQTLPHHFHLHLLILKRENK